MKLPDIWDTPKARRGWMLFYCFASPIMTLALTINPEYDWRWWGIFAAVLASILSLSIFIIENTRDKKE